MAYSGTDLLYLGRQNFQTDQYQRFHSFSKLINYLYFIKPKSLLDYSILTSVSVVPILILFLFSFNISSHLRLGLQREFFIQDLRPKFYIYFSSPSFVVHIQQILSSWIWRLITHRLIAFYLQKPAKGYSKINDPCRLIISLLALT